jgi:hypothetical protein
MTYQAAPAPAATAGQTGQPDGQMAQSNSQTYQSFSAETAVPANGPAVGYPVQFYPAYGGSSYGYSSDWRSLDNARFNGVNPGAYP